MVVPNLPAVVAPLVGDVECGIPALASETRMTTTTSMRAEEVPEAEAEEEEVAGEQLRMMTWMKVLMQNRAFSTGLMVGRGRVVFVRIRGGQLKAF